MFYLTLSTGNVPVVWKMALVLPLHKDASASMGKTTGVAAATLEKCLATLLATPVTQTN